MHALRSYGALKSNTAHTASAQSQFEQRESLEGKDSASENIAIDSKPQKLEFHPVVKKYIDQFTQQLSDEYEWSKNGSDLTPFFKDVQHSTTEEIEKRQERDSKRDPSQIILEYLASSDADLESHVTHNDFSHPLSSYYISSSHNTYLTGNQLSSDASIDGYKRVLLKGCRSVEVDVWNGKDPDEEERSGSKRDRMKEKILRTSRSKDEPSVEGLKISDDGKHGFRDRLKQKLHHSDSKPEEEKSEPVQAQSNKQEGLPVWNPRTQDKVVEPRVLHGHTLTSEVPFRNVCEAIRDTAFVKSDLPVIVSLEVHTSLEQQQIMVDIMKSVWKDHLVNTADPGDGDPHSRSLPSPDRIRHKILVKVKYTPPEVAKEKKLQDAEEPRKKSLGGHKEEQKRNDTSSPSSSEDEDEKAGKKAPKKKMLDALSELGVYTRAYHFKGFDQPEAKLPTHVFSLSEGSVANAADSSESASHLFRHNRHFLMRTYPKGFRISSSNLDPCLSWLQGVQMAALNWQKCDKGNMLNHGMFSGTGGWMLKPEAYLAAYSPTMQKAITPSATPANIPTKVLSLTIGILAGQNIPLPMGMESAKSFRPYVKCVMHVPSTYSEDKEDDEDRGPRNKTDKKSKQSKLSTKTRTYHIQQSAHHSLRTPEKTATSADVDFTGEAVSFTRIPLLPSPPSTEPLSEAEREKGMQASLALSFLRFKIMDNIEMRRDELAAWACIRLDRLRQGYRILRLFDGAGMKTEGILLVKVAMTLE